MKKILIVDDEETIRLACSFILKRAGYQTLTANGKAEALEILESQANEVETLISDTRMGPADAGLQLIKEVRTRWPHINCVLMSGEPENQQKALELGVAFLEKPFQIETLLKVVAAVPANT